MSVRSGPGLMTPVSAGVAPGPARFERRRSLGVCVRPLHRLHPIQGVVSFTPNSQEENYVCP